MSDELASTSLLDVSSDGDGHLQTQAVGCCESSLNNRRISTRSIKRKKFDDELVESSLKSERVRLKPQPWSDVKPSAPAASVSVVEQVEAPVRGPPPAPEKRKIHKSSKSSKRKKSKAACVALNKDLGRWKAQDDLALIMAVQQTCDLNAVYLGVKFSCKFTLNEVQERWYTLLYDPTLSKLALQAIKQLHPDIAAAVHAKTLFSKEEESRLASISSSSQPTIDTFEELLEKDRLVFLTGRTAKVLYNHWLLMKQYHLLPDQTVQPMPKGDHVLNFSDAEDLINDHELQSSSIEDLENELAVADRRQKKEIRHLEQELPKWQVMVDSVTGISPPEFDHLTLAVIRGRLVRYLMRSKEITLGRATKDNQIDVDLSLEGPSWKISRRQGIIKLKNNSEFYIAKKKKVPTATLR